MSSHQSTRMMKDEWLTPPELIHKLGLFDLDPCSPIKRPWSTAHHHFTINDDGLSKKWHGRVWMNPPYGPKAGSWLNRLANHGTGTALIFARTETKFFFDHVWQRASALLFIKGRIRFYNVDGSPGRSTGGAPSVLVAYGELDANMLQQSQIQGAYFNKKSGIWMTIANKRCSGMRS